MVVKDCSLGLGRPAERESSGKMHDDSDVEMIKSMCVSGGVLVQVEYCE